VTVDDTVLRAFCHGQGIRSLRLLRFAARTNDATTATSTLLIEIEPDGTPGPFGVEIGGQAAYLSVSVLHRRRMSASRSAMSFFACRFSASRLD
jgi:hypothetical protein